MRTTGGERLSPDLALGAAAVAVPVATEWAWGRTHVTIAPTDDDVRVIQHHTEWGARLLDELGGFPPGVRGVVHDHHERLDGSGLAGDELPLDTRILAVCDVYDALISSRVYRGAWTHAQAMELVLAEAGTGFDARVVDTLGQVLAAETEAPAVRHERVPAPAPIAAAV